MDKSIFESQDSFAARKRVWQWAIECIEGQNKQRKLFCSHLMVDEFDLTALNQKLCDFCKVENIKVFSEKVERFFLSRPSQGESLFQYYEKLVELKKEIERVSGQEEQPFITERLLTWKLLQAVPTYHSLSFFFQNLCLSNTDEVLKKNQSKSFKRPKRSLRFNKPFLEKVLLSRCKPKWHVLPHVQEGIPLFGGEVERLHPPEGGIKTVDGSLVLRQKTKETKQKMKSLTHKV